MLILGLADGIDAGAAVVIDDHVAAASEQERHDGLPRSRAFPWQAIDEALTTAGVGPSDVDLVVLAGRFSPPFFVRRHPGVRRLTHDPFSPLLDAKVFAQAMMRQTGLGALDADRASEWLHARLRAHGLGQRRVLLADTHRALAAAAYRSQSSDPVLIATLHPRGDGAAAVVHRGAVGQLDRQWEQRGFSALHVHLHRCMDAMGLRPLVDDDLLWALGARAEPDVRLVDGLARDLSARGMRFTRAPFPLPSRRGSWLYRALGAAPRAVAAASVYVNLKRAVCAWVAAHVRRTGIADVALGGAVFDNPRLVADVAALAEVDQVSVCPLAGWASLPLGAALSLSGLAPGPLPAPGLGAPTDPGRCATALHEAGVASAEHTVEATVEVLQAGGAVARFAGRAGHGRMAMGTRSVLVRADDPVAVRSAAKRLGLPPEAEPSAIVGEDTPLSVQDAQALRGPSSYAAAAVRLAAPAPELAGATTADGRLLLQRLHGPDDPELAAVLEGLTARTGCTGLACWPLGRAAEPSVSDACDAVRIWRAAELEALWLGPRWARR